METREPVAQMNAWQQQQMENDFEKTLKSRRLKTNNTKAAAHNDAKKKNSKK
jgi:hypothetical protein